MMWWQGSDVKLVVVCFSEHCNFVLGAHLRGGGAVCPVSERRTIGCVGESCCPGQRAGAVSPDYHAARNKFERFRVVLELINRLEFEFCRGENYIF